MDTPEKLPKSTILIVDEARPMRNILRHIFKTQKFNNLFITSSEKEAIVIINTKAIDLILTDWMMPKESGLSFGKSIRAQEPELPIIMVTAMNSKEDILTAIEAGINEYILKPVVPKEVMQKTIKQLEQRKARELLNEAEQRTHAE